MTNQDKLRKSLVIAGEIAKQGVDVQLSVKDWSYKELKDFVDSYNAQNEKKATIHKPNQITNYFHAYFYFEGVTLSINTKRVEVKIKYKIPA